LANQTKAKSAAIKSISAINNSNDNNAILANVFFTDKLILLIILQDKRNIRREATCVNEWKSCARLTPFNSSYLNAFVWRSVNNGGFLPLFWQRRAEIILAFLH
jgi:hypothetical protein